MSATELKSLVEHYDLLIKIFGMSLASLLACLIYIFRGVLREIRDVRSSLDKISDELFTRVHQVELSVGTLWAEHRVRHNQTPPAD